MSAKPIMISRSIYLNVFSSFLRELGTPVDRDLAAERLPSELEGNNNAYVPVFPQINFVVKAEAKEAFDDLGFEAARRLRIEDINPRFLALIGNAQTLYSQLETFCDLAFLENNYAHFWIKRCGDNLRICSHLSGCAGIDYLYYSDWIQNFWVVLLVRQYAGPDWTPQTFAFQSDFRPGNAAREMFPNTRFLSAQPCSWIDLPVSLLCLRRLNDNPAATAGRTGQPGYFVPFPASPDLLGSLKAVLPSYLAEGYLPIQTAAEIAGSSVRTFQRQLAAEELSYSELIQNVRFEEAARLLRDTDTKIIDIAFAVGYKDSAHFSRAFQKIAGISPRQFRQSQPVN